MGMSEGGLSELPKMDMSEGGLFEQPKLGMSKDGLSEARTNVPDEGIEHLIDAVAQLRDRGTHVNVFVAGTGDEDYVDAMRDRVRSAGLEDRFIWTGHVGGDLKNSLYSACDVFALPTSQENFGFVFFESLASATPVITTDLVDTRFEIERSGGGVIIPQAGNAFADAIESFARGDRDGGLPRLPARERPLTAFVS